MVYVPQLWLPILLSAVFVFIASSLVHMVLQWHKSDYQRLPDEEKLLEAMRNAGVQPGNYHFPRCERMADMAKPEMMDKLKKGPVGLMNVMPSGAPNMGKYLGQWFVFCIVIGVFVAYLAGRTLAVGAPYISVFRFAGTVAFLGYSGSEACASIWKGQRWSATVKHIIDGLIYALLTAGTFGWLWPR